MMVGERAIHGAKQLRKLHAHPAENLRRCQDGGGIAAVHDHLQRPLQGNLILQHVQIGLQHVDLLQPAGPGFEVPLQDELF